MDKREELPRVAARSSVENGRRTFLTRFGGATVVGLAATAIELGPLAESANANPVAGSEQQRTQTCYSIRQQAALAERHVPMATQLTNGDEQLYTNYIGNFSKGLSHNAIGEVDTGAYNHLLSALTDGTIASLEDIPLGGNTKLVNPMAGLAFDLEGADSHQFAVGPPPPVASRARADEMVELYWKALCRDISFGDYETDRTARAAAAELSSLFAFTGPRSLGQVTAQTLFRGFNANDLSGPYLSQLLLKPFAYGQYFMTGRITTYVPWTDYLTDQTSWLAARNGQGPFAKNQNDPQVRYIRNGRDLGAYVHTDQVYEAFYNAGLFLFGNGAPLNPGNPYRRVNKQTPFATFGGPHFLTLLAEVANRALKAVWYAKWFVHRTLRPEDFGGLVHMTKTNQADYPLHGDVLNSTAAAETFAKYGTYLHPQAYPEGCPQHPSYAEGHSSIAGACATILKAAFDGSAPFNTLTNGTMEIASGDGSTLVPYAGSDSDQCTINGEINKLASNIGLGRDFAGVHWRSDSSDGLRLGEAVALSVLSDQRGVYGERFSSFTITKFDGTTIAV